MCRHPHSALSMKARNWLFKGTACAQGKMTNSSFFIISRNASVPGSFTRTFHVRLQEWNPEHLKTVCCGKHIKITCDWKTINQKQPPWKAASLQNSIVKAFWSLWNSLESRDDILYKKNSMWWGQVSDVCTRYLVKRCSEHAWMYSCKNLRKNKKTFYWVKCRKVI